MPSGRVSGSCWWMTCWQPGAPRPPRSGWSGGWGGQVVGAAFLVELEFLNGRDRLPDVEVRSLLQYQE